MRLQVTLRFVVLSVFLSHVVEGQITSCADTQADPGKRRCVSWQQGPNGNCIPTFVSNIGNLVQDGVFFLSTPGYPFAYPVSQACTWNIANNDMCKSLQFILLDKDFHKGDADGSNCETSDQLEVDGGKDIFCGGETVNNCNINNCLNGVPIRKASGSLFVKFRSDQSGTGRGALAMVFEVDNGNCAGRKKRSFEYYPVPKAPYCHHRYRYGRSYYYQHHHYYYYPPPCECFGNCTANPKHLRQVLLRIVQDQSGKKALKYVNSPQQFLRGAARSALANIQNFNNTIPSTEALTEFQCPGPFPTVAPLTFPTTSTPYPTTYRPHTTRPYTRPTTRPYTHPTRRPYTHPTRRPYTRPTTRPYTRPTTRPYTRPTTRPHNPVPVPQPRYPNPYGYRG